MPYLTIQLRAAVLVSWGLTACGGSAVETVSGSGTQERSDDPGSGGTSTPGEERPVLPPIPPRELPVFCGESTLTDPERPWEQCEDGTVHRPTEAVCEVVASPRDGTCDSESVSSDCEKDTDCSDGVEGHCTRQFSRCWCNYGCFSDSDCAEGQLCDCGPGVGKCIPAPECRVDSDCEDGALCALIKGQCGNRYAACVSAESECRNDADCSEDGEFSPFSVVCMAVDGGTACESQAICH